MKASTAVSLVVALSAATFHLPAAAGLDDGLVGNWSLDDCSARDVSGSGLDGSIQGAPSCGAGRVGRALGFTPGNYFQVPHSSAFDAIETNQRLTIAAWIRPDEWYGGRYFSIVDKYEATSDFGWNFQAFPGGVTLALREGQYANCTMPLKLDSWQHVAVTLAAGQLNFYLDGKLRCAQTAPSTLADTFGEPMYVAFDPSGNDEYSIGAIDELRLYGRALAATEVKALYDRGVPVAGTVTSLRTRTATCVNLATGQSVPLPAAASPQWNCEQAGLVVTPGQRVRVTLEGVAQ